MLRLLVLRDATLLDSLVRPVWKNTYIQVNSEHERTEAELLAKLADRWLATMFFV